MSGKKYNMLPFEKHIEINTEKRFGRPVIKGTRISVYDVLYIVVQGYVLNLCGSGL